jgi:hypothetical protein
VALNFALLSIIGDADAQRPLPHFSAMYEELGYTPENARSILRTVVESYQRDRGLRLLLDAFPEQASPGSE